MCEVFVSRCPIATKQLYSFRVSVLAQAVGRNPWINPTHASLCVSYRVASLRLGRTTVGARMFAAEWRVIDVRDGDTGVRQARSAVD